MGNNLTGTIGGKSIIGTLGSGHIVMGKNVIPDWNQNDPQAEDYIKNRPGGYDTPPTVDIRWDGDLTGKEKVQVEGNVYFVKIANEAPSFESFKENKVIVEVEGQGNIGAQNVVLSTSGNYYTASDVVFGVLSGYVEIDGAKLSKGLWFIWMGQAEKTRFIKRITSLDGAVKFPVKYMPNDITSGIREAQSAADAAHSEADAAHSAADAAHSAADAAKTVSDALGSAFFNDTVTFNYDGSTTGKAKFAYNAFTYYKISDYVPNVDYVERSSGIAQDGRVITGIYKGTKCAQYGGLCVAVEKAGTCTLNDMSFTAPERGLYACTGNATMTLKSITFNMLCDEHYMFLASSTSGSAKKFKMTVDDTGVPSFTDTGDTANKFMPVKDVQVAGSSVLVNGVANVPIASETTPGVVSILAPVDSGIWNDNGSLKVSYATDAEISSRTGTRKTIVCSNMDTAVKAAMCDGKGAAWTDVERLAALLRLGCTVGDDGIVRWTAQTGG